MRVKNIIKILLSGCLITVILGFTINLKNDKLDDRNVNTFEYIQDGEKVNFYQVVDSMGMPLLYYRHINQFPCKSEKVCKIMVLNMYWDIYGNFHHYQLEEKETLTKLNHKDFSDADYKKLHKILNNPNSEFQWCQYDELTTEECENQYHVDAITGATSDDIEFEYINGAIKTTYALWNIANGSICDSIRSQTKKALSKLIKTDIYNHITNSKSFNEIWQWYKKGNDIEKTICLLYLNQSEIKIPEDNVNELFNELSQDNNTVYSGILQAISSKKLNSGIVKQKILPKLETDCNYRYMVTYNAIQRAGQNRLLKKRELNVWQKEL